MPIVRSPVLATLTPLIATVLASAEDKPPEFPVDLVVIFILINVGVYLVLALIAIKDIRPEK